MKKLFTIAFILSFIFLYCNSKPRSLSDQLKSNLLVHLNRVDSTVVLDTFYIEHVDTMVEKLGKMIDDTLYKMSLHRVEDQLANAIKEKKRDSIEFYQGELNYMLPQSDSLTKAISTADTTKKFGLLVVCRVQISRDKENRNTRLYYYLDQHMVIRNSERVDTAVAELAREMY